MEITGKTMHGLRTLIVFHLRSEVDGAVFALTRQARGMPARQPYPPVDKHCFGQVLQKR